MNNNKNDKNIIDNEINKSTEEVDKVKKDLIVRLRRIEGQVKGIEKMVQSDCCCKQILVQISAIRAAINKVGALILERYAKQCLFTEEINEEEIQQLEDLVNVIVRYIK